MPGNGAWEARVCASYVLIEGLKCVEFSVLNFRVLNFLVLSFLVLSFLVIICWSTLRRVRTFKAAMLSVPRKRGTWFVIHVSGGRPGCIWGMLTNSHDMIAAFPQRLLLSAASELSWPHSAGCRTG